MGSFSSPSWIDERTTTNVLPDRRYNRTRRRRGSRTATLLLVVVVVVFTVMLAVSRFSVAPIRTGDDGGGGGFLGGATVVVAAFRLTHRPIALTAARRDRGGGRWTTTTTATEAAATASDWFDQFRKGASSDGATTTTFAAGRFRSRSSTVALGMGQKGGSKGDRQNRAQKKKASSSSTPTTAQPSTQQQQQQPQRVSNQINVPIRRQIRYGKINKQLREAAAASPSGSFRQTTKGRLVPMTGPGANPVKRTAYRKQLDDETIERKALERQRKGRNPDWSVVLNQTKADPLVLVDGYNVIHKWARLKKHMTKGDTDRARQLLLDDLEGLASLQRWRIECVFDGAGRAAATPGPLGHGPGNAGTGADVGRNPTTAPFGRTGTVRTVFTGRAVEADAYIEGRCAAAKNATLGKTTGMLIVATDDAQIKLAASSAGALLMSSDRFVSELKAVKKGMRYRVESAVAEVNGAPIRPESAWGTTDDRFSVGDVVDYRSKPKREVLEEHPDGSKTIVARYGAKEIVIKDNRNRKPKPKHRPGEVVPKKKKKKKKKK